MLVGFFSLVVALRLISSPSTCSFFVWGGPPPPSLSCNLPFFFVLVFPQAYSTQGRANSMPLGAGPAKGCCGYGTMLTVDLGLADPDELGTQSLLL